jgi:hypothetical protein
MEYMGWNAMGWDGMGNGVFVLIFLEGYDKPWYGWVVLSTRVVDVKIERYGWVGFGGR